jgi:putative endonuclease
VSTGDADPAAPLAGHLLRGRQAEEVALAHLTKAGLLPLVRNFSCRTGELDLVLLEGPRLVVVEVRYRASASVVSPVGSITLAKCQRIVRATRVFLARHPHHARRSVRFDVVGVTGHADAPQLEWIPGAFTLDDVSGC